MAKDNFLRLLKDTAKEQSFLGREKLIPDQLSDLANFVANYLWQSILFLAIFSAILLNLWISISNSN
jgi:hypothetical protein